MSRVRALIAMKEKSERVVNKNVRDINGKPLFYWVLSMLSDSKVIDEIIVDTDSKNMEEKIKSYFPNVTIKIRPEHIIGNEVSMNAVVENSLSYFDNDDIIFQTNVTNPLLRLKTVEKAIEEFKSNHCETLLSVNMHYNMFYDKDGVPINHDLANLQRTQDLDPLIEQNHTIHVFKKSAFSRERGKIGYNPHMFVMDAIEAWDIDYEYDFAMAELFLKNRDEFYGILDREQ